MIGYLKGKLADALPNQALVDVQGVGYEVLIPTSTFQALPTVGQDIKLLTHLVVREDAHQLYGFATAPERDLFRLLINSVSGIGPKIALSILSGMNVSHFRSAVASRDVKALSQISGVGKKTAERILVELGDKMGASAGWDAPTARNPVSAADQQIHDAVLALMALGYKQPDALTAAREAQAILGAQAQSGDLVRASLKRFSA